MHEKNTKTLPNEIHEKNVEKYENFFLNMDKNHEKIVKNWIKKLTKMLKIQ